MDRRAALLGAGLLLLCACDTEQKPVPTATLTNNSNIQEAMKKLASAISDLEGEVGSFQDTNWREVVPGVEEASGNVRDTFAALQQALGISNG